MELKTLKTEREQKPARLMVHELITPTNLTKYKEDELQRRKLRNLFTAAGLDAPEVHDLWLGAFDHNQLIGAIHATSFLYHWDINSFFRLDTPGQKETLKSIRYCCENTAFIEELAVTPNYRGQGIGKELLQACYNYFQEHQVTKFSLAARKIESREFFAHAGFQNFKHTLPTEYFTGVGPVTMRPEYRPNNIYMGIDLRATSSETTRQ